MRWSINLSRIYHVQLMWPSSYCIWICIADGFISSFRCLLHIYFNRQQNGISMVLCLLLQPSTIIVQWPDKRKNESRHIDESVRLNEWCEWTDEQKKKMPTGNPIKETLEYSRYKRNEQHDKRETKCALSQTQIDIEY